MTDSITKETKDTTEVAQVVEQAPIVPGQATETPEVVVPVDQATVEAEASQEIEAAKEQMQAVEQKQVPKKKPPRQKKVKAQKTDDIMTDLKDLMALDKPKQVKVLVYLAFKKGVHHAADLAKKLKDPYLMDEFHDTLVDEVYDLLAKKKKIK